MSTYTRSGPSRSYQEFKDESSSRQTSVPPPTLWSDNDEWAFGRWAFGRPIRRRDERIKVANVPHERQESHFVRDPPRGPKALIGSTRGGYNGVGRGRDRGQGAGYPPSRSDARTRYGSGVDSRFDDHSSFTRSMNGIAIKSPQGSINDKTLHLLATKARENHTAKDVSLLRKQGRKRKYPSPMPRAQVKTRNVRTIVACIPCKKRRQKCDGTAPTCLRVQKDGFGREAYLSKDNILEGAFEERQKVLVRESKKVDWKAAEELKKFQDIEKTKLLKPSNPTIKRTISEDCTQSPGSEPPLKLHCLQIESKRCGDLHVEHLKRVSSGPSWATKGLASMRPI